MCIYLCYFHNTVHSLLNVIQDTIVQMCTTSAQHENQEHTNLAQHEPTSTTQRNNQELYLLAVVPTKIANKSDLNDDFCGGQDGFSSWLTQPPSRLVLFRG